jgi:hypothetical protein
MAEEHRCTGCDRAIEWCSFCGDESCSVCLCYRCVATDLKELTPQPHGHGG